MVRRLLKAVATAGATQVVLLVIQTATVPVFLHFWGRQLFSEWLVLTAIPYYLTFTDFGFSVVAGNEMAVRAGSGDRASALEALQSILAVVTVILACVFGLSVVLILLVPVDRLLHIVVIHPDVVRRTLMVLCLQVLVNIEGAVITAGYKCDGNYARGIMVTCWIRVAEFAVVVAGLAATCGPYGASMAVLAARIVGLSAATVDLKRRSPWIAIGWSQASRSCARSLLGPAIAASGLPIGQALSFQGMVIAISAGLGPVAAATFSTLRNLSRLPVQFITAAASGSSAEFCMVVGQGDLDTARRLMRRITQLVLWATVAMLIALAVLGRPLYEVWTMHRYAFDHRLLLMLLAVTVPSTIWINMSNTAVILKRHQGMTGVYVLATVLCVGATVVLSRTSGIVSCAGALLAFDSVSAAVALAITVRCLGDDPWSFLRFVAVPPVGWMLGRMRLAQRGAA